MSRPPPRSTLFPYTPLSRSRAPAAEGQPHEPVEVHADAEPAHQHHHRHPVRDGRAAGGGEPPGEGGVARSEEHTSELQSQSNLVCRLLLAKKTHIGYDADCW